LSSYACTVCENVFTDSDLEEAVQVGGGHNRSRKPMTYVFADRSFHYLRKVKTKKQPQTPAPEPKEALQEK